MYIVCHENPYIDSIFHIPVNTYNEAESFHFIGAPSVHEHIILNDKCADISFCVDGKTFESDGHIVCGKFTHAPQIKIIFKNTDKNITIIRLTSYGMSRLTDMPMPSLINHVVTDSSSIDFELPTYEEIDNYVDWVDSLMYKQSDQKSYNLTQEIIRYVNANFSHLPTNSTKMIAERFGLSESSIRRYFKQYLGINLSTYIITVKRKKMVQAIYEGSYDTLSIQENGYYDQSHFLNDFKRLYGVPLKQYLNEIQAMKQQAPEVMKFLYYCNILSDV